MLQFPDHSRCHCRIQNYPHFPHRSLLGPFFTPSLHSRVEADHWVCLFISQELILIFIFGEKRTKFQVLWCIAFYFMLEEMENQSQSEAIGEKLMLPPPPGTFQDREELIKHVREFGASQGYVVTIEKSRRDRRVILGCDRGGLYCNRRKMDESKRKWKASSRLINCPFEAIGKKDDDVWALTIRNGEHNHEPLRYMSEHPYSRRFTEEEVMKIKQMTQASNSVFAGQLVLLYFSELN